MTETGDTIRLASPHDMDQIVELAAAYRLDSMSAADAERWGFFVSDFSRRDYTTFLDVADHFYVLDASGRIEGYVLAYSSERIQAGEWLNMKLREAYGDTFVLIKQLAIRKRATSKGYGSRLYDHVAKAAPGRRHMAAIVLDPPNRRSVAFHEKCGFHKIAEYLPPDGKPRGVWARPPD